MRYLLVGNYGVCNAGDEILREYFLAHFSEVEWKVLSAHPEEGEYARLPSGLRSFICFRWLRTLSALRRSNGMVFGGGSLFTDAESSRACVIWFLHALWARILRKPIFLTFQGIGPFRTRLGEWCARRVVSWAAFISVRDTASADRISLWKKSTEVVQTFDPSISLLKDKCSTQRTNNVFIFIPRLSTGWSRQNREKVCSILASLQDRGDEVRILSLQPSDAQEQKLCHTFGDPLGVSVHPAASMEDVLLLIEGATCVITQRYHGSIAAALSCGIPFHAIHLREGDKLNALAGMCGCPSETLDSLSPASVLDVDWGSLRERVISLCNQYVRLVEQGENSLRGALT
jgi:polysaccharide pyruvyl transferase WcaK-like protein